MLRLWPDEFQIGLFADHCWLRRKAGGMRDYPQPLLAGEQGERGGQLPALLHALGAMLDDPGNCVRPGAWVALTVSDTLAATVALPWQESLNGANELRRYAEVLFDRQGREIGPDWLVRAEFHAYASQGLAFALPRSLVEQIEQCVLGRGLRLRRILPATAAAFYLPWRGGREGRRLVMLEEPWRVTSLVFSAGAFDGIDVEPSTAGRAEGARRLLRRTAAAHGGLSSALHWSSRPDGDASMTALIAAEMPDLKPVPLVRETLR